VRVAIYRNSIQKLDNLSNRWDAGAISAQSLNGDGYVAVTAKSLSSSVAFGLSNGNGSANLGDIDFAIALVGSTVRIYENGLQRGSFGAYSVGDTFYVKVTGSTVAYYRNNTALYVSTRVPTYPLLLDSSIRTPGGWVYNAYTCARSGAASP
jgi:hypothetical protein